MNIPYIDLGIQHISIKDEILSKIDEIISNGQFILGEETTIFENKFSELVNAKFSLGVASGTDALILSLKALNIGKSDEIITVPNSFLATASSIALVGAKPVFVDVKEDMNIDPDKIEKVINKNTKAIIPVHLTGKPANMNRIMEIANKYNLFVIEDVAQAIGAKYNGKNVGSYGITGCFSLHPLKNLSACGDGGVITTNDENIFNKLKIARNHGLVNRDECEFWSLNSRLDNLQSAILNVKLKYINKWNKRRREIASIYRKRISEYVLTPKDEIYEESVYHTFIIQTERRDELQKYIETNGIQTKIHYPIPIHLQKAAEYLAYKKGDFPVTEKQCKTILSLPVYPELTNEQIDYICNKIIKFFKNI